jgi:hypothetical protein
MQVKGGLHCTLACVGVEDTEEHRLHSGKKAPHLHFRANQAVSPSPTKHLFEHQSRMREDWC